MRTLVLRGELGSADPRDLIGPIKGNLLASLIDKDWNILVEINDISQLSPRLLKGIKSKLVVLTVKNMTWLDTYFISHIISIHGGSKIMLGLSFERFLELASLPLLTDIPIFLFPGEEHVDWLPRVRNENWGLFIGRNQLARFDKLYRDLLAMEPRYIVFDNEVLRDNFLSIEKAFCGGYSISCPVNCLDVVECLIKCPVAAAARQIEPT
ncbi:hypothetical protein [Thermocladium modestius]|uniref:hypothetical protein n=1 Tax=Thermocladium modestius TaxID=62609 RepID=UPI001669A38F|nr:hypothetical protein [Thermocladium modestius]